MKTIVALPTLKSDRGEQGHPGYRLVPCYNCNGSGEVRDKHTHNIRACVFCKGTGMVKPARRDYDYRKNKQLKGY